MYMHIVACLYLYMYNMHIYSMYKKIYIYIYIYIYIRVYVYVYTCIFMHLHADVCLPANSEPPSYFLGSRCTVVASYKYMCMCVCVCMCIYIHSYMHAYIHTDIHRYIHTCRHTYTHAYINNMHAYAKPCSAPAGTYSQVHAECPLVSSRAIRGQIKQACQVKHRQDSDSTT